MTDTGRHQRGRTGRRHGEAGFSLLELLVVLVIMVLLASLVGPRVLSYLGSSKRETAQVQIKSLGAALDLYFLDAGRYPSTEDGLGALVVRPEGVSRWNGPYLSSEAVPPDPWGNPYAYEREGSGYVLRSLGADGEADGEGADADIVMRGG
ncbi:MAG: type II secretion system major pseudopilin GspG [Alphaproteobacteria bacterium]|nr:type II secretion system major pseudopilin GspG [Alphaproteobacteria bacterium]